MSEHTKGPWTVDEEGWEDEGLCIYGGGVPMSSGEHAVAFVVNYGGTVEAAEANARLIAAAPELLEACRDAAIRLEVGNFPNNPTYRQLAAAIAKAEGTQED